MMSHNITCDVTSRNITCVTLPEQHRVTSQLTYIELFSAVRDWESHKQVDAGLSLTDIDHYEEFI